MKKALTAETLVPPLLLAAFLLLRLFHNVFENDELQHLHVVWSWTRGLVQYKDVFDNHAPLYHLLTAAGMRLTGAGAGAGWLFLARALSLPVFAGLLAVSYRLGRELFSLKPAEALLAACLLGVVSPFMAMAARPEPLWLLFFFLSLLLLASPGGGTRRSFLAGLANGAGAMVSLKTLALLLPAQALGLAALHLCRRTRPSLRSAAAFAAGLAAAPALVAVYFVKLDAFRELLYYTLTYNASGAPLRLSAAGAGQAAAVLLAGGYLLKRYCARAGDGLFFYLSTAAALAALLALYPVMEHQTVLPLRLMLYAAAAALAVRLARPLGPAGARAARLALFGAVLLFQLWNTGALRAGNSGQLAYIGRALELAGPDGQVMDAKGETVFGRRPFYYALELLAQRRLDSGAIADEIPERMTAAGTKLLLLWYPARFTEKDREFFARNYVPLPAPYERLLAAGKRLRPGTAGTDFDIAIPADYLASCSGGGRPYLDGKPYAGTPVHLAAGRHRAAGPGCGELELIWSKAAPGAAGEGK